jgi:aspartate racemase
MTHTPQGNAAAQVPAAAAAQHAPGRSEPLVGVLGGMGPAATVDFYAKLIRRTPATRDQDHLRVVIWADPTVPDRVGAILDGSTDPYPKLLAGARQLGDAGATVLAIACNTAHAFLPRLVADTGLPFLDMVAETVAALGAVGSGKQVALLGTRGLLRSGLYQERLGRSGIGAVLVDEPQQQQIDRVIASVKAGSPRQAGRELEPVLQALADGGADRVILACTELPPAAESVAAVAGLELFDPTDLLAAAVVRECGRG